MPRYSPKKNIKNITIILFFFCLAPFLFAQEESRDTNVNRGYKEVKLTELQKEARAYRNQGLQFQNLGNLAQAMSFYQKAIELDSSYVVVYNDVGIIYEMAGFVERAEENYLKAIQVDPNYLSTYSNLALLYEGKRDLNKAVFYWEKRVELGSIDDPWTKRAKDRLNDLAQVLPDYRQKFIESETVNLIRQVAENKRIKQQEDLKKSEGYLASAKKFYTKGEYIKAMGDIEIALSLDPKDKEKIAMKEKINAALDEQKRKENAKRMKEYFDYGIRYYQQGDLEAAQREFNKITELTASPQEN